MHFRISQDAPSDSAEARQSAVQRAADDGFECLLVCGVFDLAHVAPGAVGLEREELFFQRVEQGAIVGLGIGLGMLPAAHMAARVAEGWARRWPGVHRPASR